MIIPITRIPIKQNTGRIITITIIIVIILCLTSITITLPIVVVKQGILPRPINHP